MVKTLPPACIHSGLTTHYLPALCRILWASFKCCPLRSLDDRLWIAQSVPTKICMYTPTLLLTLNRLFCFVFLKNKKQTNCPFGGAQFPPACSAHIRTENECHYRVGRPHRDNRHRYLAHSPKDDTPSVTQSEHHNPLKLRPPLRQQQQQLPQHIRRPAFIRTPMQMSLQNKKGLKLVQL